MDSENELGGNNPRNHAHEERVRSPDMFESVFSEQNFADEDFLTFMQKIKDMKRYGHMGAIVLKLAEEYLNRHHHLYLTITSLPLHSP